MTIIGQNRKTAINYSNVMAIQIHDTYISAHPANGGSVVPLGLYDTKERAEEVFIEMSNTIFPDQIGLPYQEPVAYYMPEV